MTLDDKAQCWRNIKVACKLQMAADWLIVPYSSPHWAVSVTMYEQIFMAFYATMDLGAQQHGNVSNPVIFEFLVEW